MSIAAGIEVTRACNFRCGHCFVDAGARASDELTAEEIARALADLCVAGAEDVCWSGGEPLLRRDLDRLTELARDQGLLVSMVSNGYFATRDRLARLQDRGLVAVQISLDGPDRASAERWRQGPEDAFERAVQAVKTCVGLGLQTSVCALLTPETAGELEAMIALCRQLGAHCLRYTLWGASGRAKGRGYSEEAWAGAPVRGFLERYESLRGSKDPAVLLDCATGPLPSHGRFDCLAGLQAVYVCANGDVFPCTSLMDPHYRVGNLREVRLLALLRDPDMLRVHRDILRAPCGGACGGCGIAEDCHGGCPGNAVALWGKARKDGQSLEAPICLRRLHVAS